MEDCIEVGNGRTIDRSVYIQKKIAVENGDEIGALEYFFAFSTLCIVQ